MSAQFFAWYPTTLAPVPVYTTPRRTKARHTRPNSVASSTPHSSTVDLLRASTSSSGGSRDGIESRGGHGVRFYLPRERRHQQQQLRATSPRRTRSTREDRDREKTGEKTGEKHKLQKKRRGRPKTHVRSNSVDSVVPPRRDKPRDQAQPRDKPQPPAIAVEPEPEPEAPRSPTSPRREPKEPRDAATEPEPRSPSSPQPRREPKDAAAAAHYRRIIHHLHDPCPHLLAHPAIASDTPSSSPAPDASHAATATASSPTNHHRSTAPCCPSCCPAQPKPAPHPPSAGRPSSPLTPTHPHLARTHSRPPRASDSASNPHRPPAPFPPRTHQNPSRRATLLPAHDTIIPHIPTPGLGQPLHQPAPHNQHAMPPDDPSSRASRSANALYPRTESLSSGSASLSARTMASADAAASGDAIATRPFAPRNGRAYLNDPSLVYPLPADLAELHRQSLRTLLLIQVFGGPTCSAAYAAKPPARVLEIGCGSGFWSMMCHRYFRSQGHNNVSFTGLDIAPLAPGAGAANGGSGTPRDVAKPDPEMNWRFVRHDIRATPFPFADGEFDLVMVKDMSLAVTHSGQQRLMDEYLRVLRKGGHIEMWEGDHTIRMLRPHVAGAGSGAAPNAAPEQEEEEHRAAAALGAYVMTSNTPLSPPLNNFLVEYNAWVSRALEQRDISAVPCTLVGPLLLQESDILTDVRSRRLAIPLSEVRWEKEGVGGVVTKDGKSYIDTRGRGSKGEGGGRKALSGAQAALRRTALETVVQGVQGMEPMLRDVSGKRADEWEAWMGKMAGDLMGDGGTSWGECLEVGAWWAQKR